MNKLVFRCTSFLYIAFIILNLIDKTNDIPYSLGVNDGSIVVKSNITPETDNEITIPSGPSIQYIHVNAKNPNHLIIAGERWKYLSLDHGVTWKQIELSESYIKIALWVNDTILASTLDGFIVSEDFGKSWKPVTIISNSEQLIKLPEFTENFEQSWKSIPLSDLDEKTLSGTVLTFSSESNAILELPDNNRYQFKLNGSVLEIKEKYIETTTKPRIYRNNIKLHEGEIPAVLSESVDGIWAATLGGVFFQKNGSTNWEDKSASLEKHSFNRNFESQQGNQLLILDQIGRLAISKDRGKSWKSLVNDVSKAEFLNDESIVVVQKGGRVLLIDENNTVEIAPDWKLIQNENPETISSLYNSHIYFIHGDKNGFWLTTGPLIYLQETPIEISHYEAISKSYTSLSEVLVYYYNRNKKQWMVKSWSSDAENKYAIEDRCKLSLDYDNVVSINRHRTSDYGTSEKVMLIQSGKKYAYFDDSEVHVRKLKNCNPFGIKRVWNFDRIVSPAAYYETDEGLEVVSLGHLDGGTINRIKINLNDTPPLWRWFFYFFYYQYGVYIIGIGLVIWFFSIRKKTKIKV